MPLKITPAIRATIKQIVADSSQYDASTLRISQDGSLWAKRDADKAFCGHDPRLYHIGWAEHMVTQNGTRQEGY